MRTGDITWAVLLPPLLSIFLGHEACARPGSQGEYDSGTHGDTVTYFIDLFEKEDLMPVEIREGKMNVLIQDRYGLKPDIDLEILDDKLERIWGRQVKKNYGENKYEFTIGGISHAPEPGKVYFLTAKNDLGKK